MPADHGKLKPLRPLGKLETFEAVRYTKGLFSNVATSAVYSNLTPGKDLQLKPLVFTAMRGVVSRHRPLSTVFMDAENESKKPYYARLGQVDLRDCIIFETRGSKAEWMTAGRDDELDRLLERYHNTRFDECWGQFPLWRLIILHNPGDNSRFVACFFYLHAIGDGNAGPSFHRTFLAELSALSGQQHTKEPDPVVPSTDVVMPPSLESIHKLPLSPGFLLKMAWYDKFPKNSPSLWLGAPVTEPSRSRFRSFSLAAGTTRDLLAVCRAHSVTMTATVHALMAQAIFSNLPDDKTQLKSRFAIDLRRFLPAGTLLPDEMGNYVSTTVFVQKRTKAGTSAISWAEAQRIKTIIDGEIKLGGKNASTGCLRWVGSIHKFFSAKFGQVRDGSFCLTNLGVFKSQRGDRESWRTERWVFSEGFDAARDAMAVTMVSGEDGCLTLGLVWGDGVVEEELMLRIFETLRSSVTATAEEVPSNRSVEG